MNSFKNLIARQKDPLFYMDHSGLIKYVNPAFLEYTGFNSDECKHTSLSSLLSFSPDHRFKALLNKISDGSDNEFAHFNICKKNGSNEEVNLMLFAERSQEKLEGISGQFGLADSYEKSVTKSKNELNEIEEKYKTLYNLTFEGIIIHDKGILIDANPAYVKIIGYTKKELIGQNMVSMSVLPEYHKKVIDAMKNEVTAPYEVLAKTKDGVIIHTEVESRRIDFGNRSVRVTAIRDITARKKVEAQLKESEERYKMLSNLTFEGIILHDQGIVIDVNQSLVDIIGYSPQELIGKNIIQLAVLPEYRERVRQAVKNDERAPYELKAQRKNGSEFFAEVQGRIVNYKGESIRVIAVRDVTWRKNAEVKLHENEEELDMFFSKSGDGFFIMKVDEPIYWNDNTDKNRALEILFSDMYLSKINNAMLGQYRTTKEKLDQNASERIFRWKEEEGRQLVMDLLNKGSVKAETEEPGINGSVIWIEGHYVVLYDVQGRVRGCSGVRRDVTERKISEETIRHHNEELKKTNQELDNFVYRVSHDLKAPISSTKGLVNIARLETEEKRKNECIEMIELSMNKLDSFIADILDYSRNSRIEVQPIRIDIEELINDVLSDTHFLREERNILIEKKIHANTAFYSDKSRMVFIFNNLISNTIRFSDEDKSTSWLNITIDISETEAKICVADNGIGIEAEHLDHIYNMFYRATETQMGSGLGLYIVKEAVEKLSGTISVTSEVNKGTTFKISIPNMPAPT